MKVHVAKCLKLDLVNDTREGDLHDMRNDTHANEILISSKTTGRMQTTMKVMVYIFVCAMALAGTSVAKRSKNKENKYPYARNKRAVGKIADVALTGLRAAKLLLKGAVQTPHELHDTRKFQKIGNLRTALRDFYAIRPQFIQKVKLDGGGYARVGIVGDRNVILRTTGPSGRPIIELIKTGIQPVHGSPTVEMIIYTKQLDLK